jgi:hypothetical protein
MQWGLSWSVDRSEAKQSCGDGNISPVAGSTFTRPERVLLRNRTGATPYQGSLPKATPSSA